MWSKKSYRCLSSDILNLLKKLTTLPISDLFAFIKETTNSSELIFFLIASSYSTSRKYKFVEMDNLEITGHE